MADDLTQAERDVIAERRRQVGVEGWTAEHDDRHADGTLATAAACYAAPHATLRVAPRRYAGPILLWPWEWRWFKPQHGRRRCLVKAAALLIAEIERLDRASETPRTVQYDDPQQITLQRIKDARFGGEEA